MNTLSTIRAARRDDVPRLQEIAAETDLFPPEALPEMISPYLDGAAPDLWFGADAGGALVSLGFAAPEALTDRTWNLLALAVDPGAQGGGIGKAMLLWIERRLREDGGRLLLVETLGSPEFAPQRAFYAAAGFVEEGRIRDYYEDGGDKVVFAKRL
ncbi:MAG: GNAT family N-acetyltransferase [Pseudomonadota bacterium]